MTYIDKDIKTGKLKMIDDGCFKDLQRELNTERNPNAEGVSANPLLSDRKRRIEYISEKILPSEIIEFIDTCQKRVLENHLEQDKIVCMIGHLKGNLIRWFAEKQIR